MKKNTNRTNDKSKGSGPLPGNPAYPASEDIYNREKKEEFKKEKFPGEDIKKPFPSLDDDLIVPGSELDDAVESIGEEDEENNYYSISGDRHEDLEEDKSI